ncbi:MAG: SDR family NAD(P)-dependent oxidoreductase [Candidatus Poseidonia sp.]|nr:SDR family NAD(P)-dependent oxidoreductase [Poseidonia sp.]MBL6806764.1 SDR family NAD(P)-dependent oxidoreductase [Poseidonia sp.]MBL6886236.1 SDR family NAD(P)-dependent oxidoreductase [Poseidonia sp.]MBL6893027.1 SDR family NAD(P)-dependent oxidoreductase [Poseidonia sp.]
MSQRILVTGGAGFIGSSLCERLLNEGHQVVALDNMFRGRAENLKECHEHPSFHFLSGDACSSDDLQRCFDLLGGIDLIHHLAAINGTRWFHEAARQVIDVNINATLATVEKAVEWGSRYVLASSPEAFGDVSSMPLMEGSESVFSNPSQHQRFAYGASKYLDEVAVQHAVRNGLDGRIVRPFNGYGVRLMGDEYGQVVAMMFEAIRRQEPINVHGDGQQTRSFTHIDDLVNGFYLAGHLDGGIEGQPLSGSSFNLGSEEEVNMLSLAQSINEVVGSQAVDIVLSEGYHGDSMRRLPNCTNAVSMLGWHPAISLKDGLISVWSGLQHQP